MNSVYLSQIFRFFICVAIQVLVFRQVRMDWKILEQVHVIFYPVFIMLLPVRTPRPFVIALGFLIGIAVDLFYHTPGVHAAAGTFTAFMRPFILNLLASRAGYQLNDSPTMAKFGFWWFAGYASCMLLLHLAFYFSMEVFTPVEIGTIFIRTMASVIPSLIFILIIVRIVNPRD